MAVVQAVQLGTLHILIFIKISDTMNKLADELNCNVVGLVPPGIINSPVIMVYPYLQL